MEFVVEYEPSDHDKQLLLNNLIKSNIDNGMQQKTDCWVFAYDDHGKVIAGCQFYLFPTVVWVAMLWVDKAYQQKGVGRSLLAKAEEEGKTRNCQMAFLDTFAFQKAIPFYEKCGYQHFAEVPEMAGGDQRYFMKKSI